MAKTLTVSELIAQLEGHHPDIVVLVSASAIAAQCSPKVEAGNYDGRNFTTACDESEINAVLISQSWE